MIVNSALQLKKWLKPLYGRTNLDDMKRIDDVIANYNLAYNGEGCHICSSSGRVEIVGNHTDHNGGKVLACTVNRDILAGFMPNGRGKVVIKSQGYKDIVFNISEINEKEVNSAGMVKGVLARMQQLGYNIGGFKAVVTSNVPSGAGMSSSASYQLLVGKIISYLYNDNKVDEVTLARVGQWSENNYFNKPCGLMDQATISIGGVVEMQFGDNFSYKSADMVEGYNLVVTNTGGSHANLTDQYASIPSEMFAVANMLGEKTLGKVESKLFFDNYENVVSKLGTRPALRAKHFYEDCDRAEQAITALKANDGSKLVSLIAESGNSSRYQLCNVNYEGGSTVLADAIDYSNNFVGSGATRVHGGGFAGTILAILPNADCEKYLQAMTEKFGEENVHSLLVRSVGTTVLD